MRRIRAVGCGATALATLLGGAGATNAADTASVQVTVLEEIIVTAQKRSQVAQDIPISLYAITGDVLEQQGITTIQDLGNTLAGVNIGAINPGQMRLTIRGAGDISGSNQASPVNGYYLDETAMSYVPGYMPELGLWDVERIEVLRGPQGTLFGEGSEGGTLRVITKKPDSTKMFGRFEVSGSAAENGGDGYGVLASVNAPLKKDVLAMTLAASYRQLPGWIDIPDLNEEDSNDAKLTDGRVAFRYTPSEALTVDAFYLYNKTENNDFGATSPGVLQPSDVAPGSGPVHALSPVEGRLDVGALTIGYDLGAATLVSASAWTKHENFTDRDYSAGLPLFFGDPSATGSQTYDVNSRAFSQELRLVSNGDERLDWTVGAYYKDEERKVQEGDSFSVPAFGGLQDLLSSLSIQDGSSWAVFGDIDYALTDRLSAQLGVRYFSEDKDFKVTQLSSSVLFGTTEGDEVSGNDSATKTSPMFGLSYEVSSDVLLFAKAAEGFRGGGSNTVPLDTYPYANADYEPDSLWAYEAGVKTTFSAWYFNAYAFYNDWSDLQLPFITNDAIFGYTKNAGSATSKGAELEAGGRIGNGLTLGLAYAYTDSTIDEDVLDEQGNLVAKGGNQIPQTSRNKVTLTMNYTANITESFAGFFNARYRQASGFFSDAPNSSSLYNEESKQLFASIGVSGKWGTVDIYGDNLLDRDDTTAKYKPIGALPYVFINYVRPRTLGIEYKATF